MRIEALKELGDTRAITSRCIDVVEQNGRRYL